MKLAKSLLVLAAGAAMASSAGAQVLVVGFDFSQFLGSGFNSTDGSSFTGQATGNYSDFYSPSPDIAAASLGSIYWDGQFGSTDGLDGFSSTIRPASNSLTSALVQTGDLFPFDSHANLTDSGQGNTNFLSLGINLTSASIVFSADLSSQSSVGSDWTLTFAAKELQSGESATINWFVSTDGSSYTSLDGQTKTTSSVDTEYSVTAGATADGSATVFFRADYTGIDTQSLLDNVGISATVTGAAVPEPSSLVGLLGAFAGLAIFFRRRR